MTIYTKKTPHLFDVSVEPIQMLIGQNLTWMDNVYGIVEKLTDKKGKKSHTLPNIFFGDRYTQLLPCRELGNFCFFSLNDPQVVDSKKTNLVTSPYSLIFWYNIEELKKEYPEWDKFNINERILSLLSQSHLNGVKYTIDNVYGDPSNIFKGFDYDFTDNQSLMYPYAGLRIDGKLRATLSCYQSIYRDGDYNEDYNEDFDIKKI